MQTTLHTTQGHGTGRRTCNQDGCYSNLGKNADEASRYGPGVGALGGLDSLHPIHVSCTFADVALNDGLEEAWRGAALDVTLSQEVGADGFVLEHFFDPVGGVYGSHCPAEATGGASRSQEGTSKGSGAQQCPRPLPPEDQAATRTALENGMALVLSLWQSDDMAWLDGGCADWIGKGFGQCSIESAAVSIANVQIGPIRPPPAPPPTPPPAEPTPPPPSPSPQPSPPPFLLSAASSTDTSLSFFVGIGVGAVLTLVAITFRSRCGSTAREICERLLKLPPPDRGSLITPAGGRMQPVPRRQPPSDPLDVDADAESVAGDTAEEDGLLEVRREAAARKKTGSSTGAASGPRPKVGADGSPQAVRRGAVVMPKPKRSNK